jgi:hypothetical protein
VRVASSNLVIRSKKTALRGGFCILAYFVGP